MSWAIDEEFADVVAAMASFDYLDIPSDRKRLAALVQSAPVDDLGVRWYDELIACDDGPLNAVGVRVYQPPGGGNGAAALHIHSGGWVVGDLDFEHGGNTRLVARLGITIVSVDYRLAPENPYPAGLNDCYAAWRWFVAKAPALGVDPARIALVGASAGAALSVGVALRSRDESRPGPCALSLRDPALDDRLATASSAFEGTPVVDRTRLVRIWDAYLGPGVPGTDTVSPYAAPLRVEDLRGLPRTYVSTSEFDPVRDDGIAFASRLLAAGVSTELHLFPGTYHGSSSFLGAAVSLRAEAEYLAFLKTALGI